MVIAASPQPKSGNLLIWLLSLVGLAAIVAAGGYRRRRQRRPTLQGQLIPISGPAGATLPLTRDLGMERLRELYLGSRGKDEWKLEGWPREREIGIGC